MDKIAQCLSNILKDLQGKDKHFQKLDFWNGSKIVVSKLKKFLEVNGFRTLKISQVSKVVKVTYNVVEVFTPQEVFNYCLKYVEAENSDLESIFLEQGEKYLMTKKALLGSLKPIELKPYKNDISTSRYFYNNCVVEVTANEIKTIPYNDFQKNKQYIFKETIINRPYKILNEVNPDIDNFKKSSTNSDYKEFLNLATNSDEHFNSVCSSKGYLLHDFKNPANAKAVIITDVLSQATNEPNGRSGKGLIIKSFSEFTNVVEYNGKNLDLKRDKFVYQSIDHSTKLFVIQDVGKNFDFEDLFSQITDKMDVQRKHTQKMIIEFSESPKIAITTNYTIPQNTDSFTDRKHLVILNNHFNANHKPEKELGKLLFLQWNESEYLAFDNFMMQCIQFYLKNGLLSYEDPELKRQNLISNTSKLFVELIESDYFNNEYYSLKELASKLEINSNENSVKSKIAKNWLKTYASYMNTKVEFRVSGGFEKFCFS